MNEKDFMEEYNTIFERSLIFSIISRAMGLVSLENLLDKDKYNQRDIFEYGMRLILDAKVPELTEKIFNNLINLETDKERKILKNMQKEAVLSIQKGTNTEELMLILNSYVNIDLDKATEKFNEINEFINKVLAEVFPDRKVDYMEMYQKFADKVVNEYFKGKKGTGD